MNSILVLADGTKINLESGSSLNSLKVKSDNKASMVENWDKFNKDNLAEITVQNSDGIVIGEYSNCVLDCETSKINADGSILTAFRLREKTETELRLEALEETQADQDDAIVELAEVVAGE